MWMADTSPISNPRARWQGNTAPIVRARVSATARCSFSTARARLHGAIAPENAGDGPGQRPHGTTPRRPNAQQFGVVLVELRENLVVKRHLIAADRAPVGGIERQDHGFSPQIGEREVLIGGDPQREIRGNGSSG